MAKGSSKTEYKVDWSDRSRQNVFDAKTGKQIGAFRVLTVTVPSRCVTTDDDLRGFLYATGILTVNGEDAEIGP